MKKTMKFLIVLALIMPFFISNAFRAHAQETHVNIRVTDVTTNFNYGNSNNALKSYKKDMKGLLAGITFQAGISKRLSVVTEGYFVTKGGILTARNPQTMQKTTVRLYAVEMPVMARLHLGRAYINAGPYVGYNLGGKIKTQGTEDVTAKSDAIYFHNDENGFNRWDMGLQAGGGYLFPFKKSILAVDIRYGYGLTTLSHEYKRFNRMLNVSVIVYKPWNRNLFAKKSTDAFHKTLKPTPSYEVVQQ